MARLGKFGNETTHAPTPPKKKDKPRYTDYYDAGIVTAIGEATMAEAVGEEVESTLTIGAKVRLVAPI